MDPDHRTSFCIKWIAATAVVLSTASGMLQAQTDASIVDWKAEVVPVQAFSAGEKTTLQLTGAIPDGWHVYSLTQPPGGPIALKVNLDDADVGSISGNIQAPAPVRKKDPAIDMETETYSGSLKLGIPVSLQAGLAPGAHDLHLSVRYQSCSDRECRPPRTVHLSARINVASTH
jgi:DsbC/DsbD-like thiol-disulfide interchange protein